MKHSKTGKIALTVFVITFVVVVLIASSVFWTHTILFVVKKSATYVGDPYQDKYTVVEITDRRVTMVADNTNHVLYDVVVTNGFDRYLMVHLDENGLPTKQTEPIIPERPNSIDFFDGDFDLVHELIQSIPMLIVEIFAIVLVIEDISKILPPLVKEYR